MNIEQHSPFKNSIINSQFTAEHPRIREIAGSKYLVRQYDLTPNPILFHELMMDYRGAISRWRELGAYEGISLPQFSAVIGEGGPRNLPMLSVVTEKIKGPNLDDLVLNFEEIPVAKNLFQEFMIGLIHYSQNAYEGKREFLNDQNLSQYVYGKDTHNGIYFVDLGLEYHKVPELPEDEGWFFAQYVMSLYIMLEGLEEKVGQSMELARDSFATFLRGIPKKSGGYSYANNILNSVIQPSLIKDSVI